MKRKKTAQLEYYEVLSKRRSLSQEEKYRFHTLKRGYEGEAQFDEYVERILGVNQLYIKDLQLQFGRQVQIDSLLISNQKVYLFEIKNYSLDLIYVNDQWIMGNNKVLHDDPQVQVLRGASILNKIVEESASNFVVEPILVFINPDTQVELNQETKVKILRSNEIKRFLEQINLRKTPSLNEEKLLQHILNYQVDFVPDFHTTENDDAVLKGIICAKCNNPNLDYTTHHVSCRCGHRENKFATSLRTIEEAQILKPDFQLTYQNLNQLFEGKISKATIYRILKKIR